MNQENTSFEKQKNWLQEEMLSNFSLFVSLM